MLVLAGHIFSPSPQEVEARRLEVHGHPRLQRDLRQPGLHETLSQKMKWIAGEMARLGSSTYKVAHNCVIPVPRNPKTSSDLQGHQARMCYTCICKQNIHIHKIK